MKQYYLCALGHTWRISNKHNNEKEAAIFCYGITSQVTSVPFGTRGWRSLNNTTKNALITQLKTRHLEQTGNHLS